MVDEDVDVFSDDDIEWAMANRFRADRDLVVVPGQMAFPMDVMAGADQLTTKAGFDLTGSFAKDGIETRMVSATQIDPSVALSDRRAGARGAGHAFYRIDGVTRQQATDARSW